MLNQRRTTALYLAIGIIVALVSLLGVQAVMAGTPDNPDITSDSCTLTVSFTAASDADYRVEIWDDGVIVFEETKSASAGDVLSYIYTFTAIGKAVPGVAVIVYEDGTETFFVDPYTAIDETCVIEVVECPGPPVNSVGARVMETTELFWSNASWTGTGVFIPVGKSVRAMGTDASGDWLYIHWACDNVWVPTSVLGPNFDEVWRGQPLPTENVVAD